MPASHFSQRARALAAELLGLDVFRWMTTYLYVLGTFRDPNSGYFVAAALPSVYAVVAAIVVVVSRKAAR